MDAYSYKLDVFEGPLDLLLHLIEKHKIDIYDIPIVDITSQYMAYLNNWQHFDIDYSSEFLVMAATLLQIKSRMLLPRESAKFDEAVEDPRDELVARLLEFKEIKALTMSIQERVEALGHEFNRPEELSVIGKENVYHFEISQLYRLFQDSYNHVKEEKKPNPLVKVEKEVFSLAGKLTELRLRLKTGEKVSFHQLLEAAKSKEEKVVSFLAVLELLKFQFIVILPLPLTSIETAYDGNISDVILGDAGVYGGANE